MILHGVFDVLALIAAVVAFQLVPVGMKHPWRVHPEYWVAASLGATLGAYAFGSVNLWVSGVHGLARSVEGGLAGGVASIELLKARAGIRGSTGVRLAVPLAVAIAVGRIGCFLAGLDDQTYGTPTSLEGQVELRKLLIELLSLSCDGQQSANVLREVLCCLPLVEVPAEIGYDRVFRVTIIQFLDRFNFCLAGVKRSCIHFVTNDGRIIPFDTYNMFHRPGIASAIAASVA